MAIDFATLGINVDITQGMYGVTQFGRKLDETGEKAKKLVERITDSSRSMTLLQMSAIKMNDEIDKSNNKFGAWGTSAKKATEHTGAWDSIMKQATGHTGEHSLSIGRLERNLAGVTERMLELNPTVGLVSSSLLKFSLGTIETVGILAGIAAIAAAWEYFTGEARKAREENDKLRESLEKGNFMASLGPSPDLVLEVQAQRNKLMQDRERLRVLTAFGAKPEDQRIIDLNVAIAHDREELAPGEKRLDIARRGAGHDLIDVKVDSTYFRDKQKAEEASLAASKRYWDGQHDLLKRARDAVAGIYETAKDFVRDNPLGGPGGVVAKTLQPDIDDYLKVTMPHVGLNDSLTPSQVRRQKRMGINLGGDEGLSFQDRLEDSLQQFSPANLGMSAVQSGLGFIAKGFTDLALGMLDGGNAAKEYARALKQQRDEYAAAIAQFKHDDLAAALAQNMATADQLLKQWQDALGGPLGILQLLRSGGAPGQIQSRDEIAKQEAKNAEIIKRQAAYAQEALNVRNMRALGQGDAADLLAFQEKQQREMQAAIDANKDATYLNTLATTQNNELIAYQNGLLSTALRNSPTGFFVEQYLSNFATPRGYPTDSGVNGGPDNAHPVGGDWSGGKGAKAAPRAPVTIVLTVGGKAIGRAFIEDLDQTAASTGGNGSSRAAALELYK